MSGSQQKFCQHKIILRHMEKRYFFIISRKTVFENLNLAKSYDKTNPNDFIFSVWENTGRLNFFWPVYFEMSPKNNADPDQTAPRSSLIWIYIICIGSFVLTVRIIMG